MSNKEKAEATYKALQERKKAKIRAARRTYKFGYTLEVESIVRHRGRSNLKYFF